MVADTSRVTTALAFLGKVTLVGLLMSRAQAGIMVIAPHPDDDIVTSSAVIKTALERGEAVKVVFMTNGDFQSIASGTTRQGEAVKGEQLLGLIEDNLIFFGYPDAHLEDLRQRFQNESSRYVSPLGQSVTYASRGLGRRDYHRYRFGKSALYNWFNVVLDLKTALQTYRPDHIYVTSDQDAHLDHAATYDALREALGNIASEDSTYTPLVHETIVHIPGDDNLWPIGADPANYYVQMPTLDQSVLRWSDRESLDVPLSMQLTDLTANLKFKAVLAHASQGGHCAYNARFTHKDEFFWVSSPLTDNQPPIVDAGNDQQVAPGARVTLDATGSRDPEGATLRYQWTQTAGPAVVLSNATSARPSFDAPDGLTADVKLQFELEVSDARFTSPPDLTTITVTGSPGLGTNVGASAIATASSANSSTGSLASKAIDGVVAGAPGNPSREWATVNQKTGWIKLRWPTAQYVDKLLLYDRPNPTDQVTCGTLTFGDGSKVFVGMLDNGAAEPMRIDITPRQTTSVTLTIDRASASTQSTGLAEMQVFDSRNAAPADTTPPTVPQRVRVTAVTDRTVTLAWDASTDSGGAGLAGYRIYRDSGSTPIGTSSSTSFTDSGLTPGASYGYSVSAYDRASPANESLQTLPITARTSSSSGGSSNIASQATAVGSTQTYSTESFASKATDGLIAGAPANPQAEWVTRGETTTAWIKLTFPGLRLIDRVVLFDRPNPDDQITGATLTLGDGGGNFTVGALDNSATNGTVISFSPRQVSWLRVNVTKVSATTRNVGLAELQVYGQP